jgi:hypothetical protein
MTKYFGPDCVHCGHPAVGHAYRKPDEVTLYCKQDPKEGDLVFDPAEFYVSWAGFPPRTVEGIEPVIHTKPSLWHRLMWRLGLTKKQPTWEVSYRFVYYKYAG